MLSVSGSTSTSTGRAPTCSITFTDALNVIGVVITSSPAPIPRVTSAVWRAAGQELSARAPGACRYAATSDAKRPVLGPVVIQLERRVSTTSWISSSPNTGREKGRNSRRFAAIVPTVIALLRGRHRPMPSGVREVAAGRERTHVTCADGRPADCLERKHLAVGPGFAPGCPDTRALQICVRAATL